VLPHPNPAMLDSRPFAVKMRRKIKKPPCFLQPAKTTLLASEKRVKNREKYA
jgi:hypothetical protein